MKKAIERIENAMMTNYGLEARRTLIVLKITNVIRNLFGYKVEF